MVITGTLDIVGVDKLSIRDDDALRATMERIDASTLDAAACPLRPARI
ncbi:MAG TPA: hypothetical protein VMV87_08070 [Burkholderiales bacterium]|nr:hypothetical protein [Burkholderiales bacterium]